MDNLALVKNIIQICELQNRPPTNACADAGVGKDLIGNIRRGQTPSVAKVADLAAYLGVTTSDLVGDAVAKLDAVALAEDEQQLLDYYRELNEEGQEDLLKYARLQVKSGEYIKNHPLVVGDKKAE